ncbi:hypothetical protein F4811DRAFT_74194 [Daldinia bambusicola]|nr:hypothetical protein F4811DRAFT_74194 [Daldinia bambusicola]
MERTNLGQEAINRDWRSVNPPEEQQDDEMSWRRNTSDPVPQRNDPEPSENPPDIPPPADVPRRVVPDYPPRQIPEQLIQHGRSTPGYPRWRRTQEEINAATESIWRRPVPEPEVYVPYLGPRASTLEADEISRIQTRGRWYIRSLPVMSRYFTREPAEKAELASEHRHDPYDLVLVLKDAHRLQTPEDFVEAILRELSTTGEYSQEIASHGKAERGGLPTRQTHANRAGRDLLEDFDLIIEEILKLQGELEIANQANSADRLFEAIAEAYGWDSTELKKSGFHQEIMSYVGIAMMGRLRYIRDFVQFDHATQEGDIMNDIDDSTITLATRQFSAAIHSASLADDVRMIEWYSYWSALFPGRHRREFEMNPHLNTQKMLNLFRDVYGFEHKYAVRLLSDSGFAEDVYIIDSFIGVRGTTNAVEPSKHAYYRGVADQYYKPYIQALIDTLDKHPVTDGTLWRRYRASPNSVPDLRRRLVQYMDKNQKPAYVGVGRWCRHKPAPGKPNLGTEHTEMRERGWRRGWYCPDHRPWIRCSSCNWKYSCAICTNPHSCPHCNQAFTCIAPGCNIRSDRYRDGRRKDYTYNVAETVKGEGWIQNGRRITPRPRNILSRMHLPPRYRAFFPKDVSDIPEEGPIFTKPVSASKLSPRVLSPYFPFPIGRQEDGRKKKL